MTDISRLRCDRTPVWGQLKARFESSGKNFDARQAFAADATRFTSFSQQAPHVFADLSKNLIDMPTAQLLFDLARNAVWRSTVTRCLRARPSTAPSNVR